MVEGVEDAYAFVRCAPSTSSTAKSKALTLSIFDFFDNFAKAPIQPADDKFDFFDTFNRPLPN